jgi:hypothetical protein
MTYADNVQSIPAAVAALGGDQLKAADLAERLASLNVGDLLGLVAKLESAQKCLRAVAREKQRQARREAAADQRRSLAAGAPAQTMPTVADAVG